MSTDLHDRSAQELSELEAQLARDFELAGGNRLALDLSRGKPAADQLSLSDGLDGALGGNYTAADGTDTRNYGGAARAARSARAGRRDHGRAG